MLVGEGVQELTSHLAGKIINYTGLVLFAVAVLLTVISGINYIVKNKSVLKQ